MLSLREKEVNKGFTWPVGTVVYSLEDAPAQGLLPLNGQYYDPTDPRYRKLFRTIGFRFGKDAQGRFCVPKLSDYLSVFNPTAAGTDANAVPFTAKGPYVRQHQHGSGRANGGGSHTHSKSFIEVREIPGEAGTNGLGSGTCGSSATSISLTACGNHDHSLSQSTYEGVVNWRPQSLITVAFIVYGGDDA